MPATAEPTAISGANYISSGEHEVHSHSHHYVIVCYRSEHQFKCAHRFKHIASLVWISVRNRLKHNRASTIHRSWCVGVFWKDKEEPTGPKGKNRYVPGSKRSSTPVLNTAVSFSASCILCKPCTRLIRTRQASTRILFFSVQFPCCSWSLCPYHTFFAFVCPTRQK